MRTLGWLFLCFLGVGPAFSADSPSCRISAGTQTIELNTPIDSLEKLEPVFQVLESFSASEKTARAMPDRFAKGEIIIAHFNEEKETASPLKNPAALFEYISGVPTIFLRKSEVGLLAALLFHEIIHANDDIFKLRFTKNSALRRSLKERSKSLIIPSLEYLAWADESDLADASYKTMVFDAEKLAVSAQRELLVEMFEKFPCTSDYFKFHEKQEHLIVDALSDEEIKSLYKVE